MRNFFIGCLLTTMVVMQCATDVAVLSLWNTTVFNVLASIQLLQFFLLLIFIMKFILDEQDRWGSSK